MKPKKHRSGQAQRDARSGFIISSKESRKMGKGSAKKKTKQKKKSKGK